MICQVRLYNRCLAVISHRCCFSALLVSLYHSDCSSCIQSGKHQLGLAFYSSLKPEGSQHIPSVQISMESLFLCSSMQTWVSAWSVYQRWQRLFPCPDLGFHAVPAMQKVWDPALHPEELEMDWEGTGVAAKPHGWGEEYSGLEIRGLWWSTSLEAESHEAKVAYLFYLEMIYDLIFNSCWDSHSVRAALRMALILPRGFCFELYQLILWQAVSGVARGGIMQNG